MKTKSDDPITGFASPNPHVGGGSIGLTKREYFAVMAMQGLATREQIDANRNWNEGRKEELSLYAVKMADALIAELNKEKL
jgi:hypothetical protein